MNSENHIETSVKKICVTTRGNKLFYPKSIPKERGPRARWVMIGLIFVLFLVNVVTSGNRLLAEIAVYSVVTFLFFIYELVTRFCLLFEEFRHLESRYEDNQENSKGTYWNVLRDTFSITRNTCLCLLIMGLYLVYFCSTSSLYNYEFQLWRCTILILPVVYISHYLLEMNSCPLNDSYWIAKNNGLDYGSGMAYSFFYGYLNLILEKTGDCEKNLKELIQDYEDHNNVQFTAYKLFILIPKSLTCFVSLSDCSQNSSIESRNSLNEKILTVAGVKNRVYKNSVYTITTKFGKKVYVCAEYATPLKTFNNVVSSNVEHNKYYKKYKNDIVLQFYLTLKKVLDQRHLSCFCEPIYYDDKDENGRFHDVGKIILNRLIELNKEEQKLKAN